MQSPQLDVADKIISSPVYVAQLRQEQEIPDHQFYFFTNGSVERESFTQELFSFGERLKRRIQNAPFHWKGFGTLRYSANQMLFEPDEIKLEALKPIPAQKILRENVQHNMLVGDQEMTSQQVTNVLTRAEYKRPWYIITGWILFILALIAIILYLYMNNFQTTSTGLRTRW